MAKLTHLKIQPILSENSGDHHSKEHHSSKQHQQQQPIQAAASSPGTKGLKARKKDFLKRRKLKKKGLLHLLEQEPEEDLEAELMQDRHKPKFGEQAEAPLKASIRPPCLQRHHCVSVILLQTVLLHQQIHSTPGACASELHELPLPSGYKLLTLCRIREDFQGVIGEDSPRTTCAVCRRYT